MRLHQLSSRSDNSGSSSRSSPSIVSGPFPSRRTSGDVSPYIILQLESIDLKLWVLLSPISGISRRYCVLRLPIAVPDPFRPLSLVPLFELRSFITLFGIFLIFGFWRCWISLFPTSTLPTLRWNFRFANFARFALVLILYDCFAFLRLKMSVLNCLF